MNSCCAEKEARTNEQRNCRDRLEQLNQERKERTAMLDELVHVGEPADTYTISWLSTSWNLLSVKVCEREYPDDKVRLPRLVCRLQTGTIFSSSAIEDGVTDVDLWVAETWRWPAQGHGWETLWRSCPDGR